MKQTVLSFLGAILISVASYGQTATFTWEEGLTQMKSTFDTKTQSITNLNLIYFHLVHAPVNMFEVGNVWSVNQMDSSFLAPLDSVYEINRKALNEVKIPETEFWQNLKQARLNELTAYYSAKRIEILSYTDPKVLMNLDNILCNNYVEALNGSNEQLLETWQNLHNEQKKVNASPEAIETRYLSELSSENSLLYAKLNVTIYGWWNCINAQIPYVEQHQRLIDEFKTLFIKTESHYFED